MSMSTLVVGVDEVLVEDDGEAGNELVHDEDEEVDDKVGGRTRGSLWGHVREERVGGARSIGEEESDSVAKTVRGQ